ncbi:MAG: carboxymuconolactone decarboxylase family protein [Rhodospirillales bacterium]|nr:carboxymuconolactone decarboxylase family protein [Rhodospirillales bacterium]
MSELTPRQAALKEEFVKARGYWSPVWDDVLALDADFFEAYMQLSSVPWKSGPLSPKVKELIYVAIDASTTHLCNAGTRIHMQNALKHGATKQELMEVLQLTSTLGIHSCSVGVPILQEELREAGREHEMAGKGLDARQQKLKDAFIEARGYWTPLWEKILSLSPDYFEAYLKFSWVPWQTGTLEPKVKELIYVAIDAATTKLHVPGIRVHVRNALKHGATAEEIMEVFQIVSVLGIHTMTESVPILMQEAKAHEAKA